ncbi:hypothetical protein DL96DRAFT_1617584 [Flagelloscypha sp. PMI_526]|nr:hypothetical protein DL96DRAFT_1617584 [Flagelloscypha sp. PMI_526]
MSLLSVFPAEILLLIFKFVERRDLCALALVSRSILPIAQDVLFSYVTIITEPPALTKEFKRSGKGTRFRATPGGFEGLVKAFSLNPSLPSKIFHLRLLFQDRHPKGITFPPPEHYETTELASNPFLPRASRIQWRLLGCTSTISACSSHESVRSSNSQTH